MGDSCTTLIYGLPQIDVTHSRCRHYVDLSLSKDPTCVVGDMSTPRKIILTGFKVWVNNECNQGTVFLESRPSCFRIFTLPLGGNKNQLN